MSLWQRFKQGAKEVAQSAAAPVTGTGILLRKVRSAVAEKYREKFSDAPQYREKRIEAAQGRMAEMEVRTAIAQKEAEYEQARAKIAQAKIIAKQHNPFIQMLKGFGEQKQTTVHIIKKGKGKVQQVVQQSPYAHIFGDGKGMGGYGHLTGDSRTGNFEYIVGSGKQKKNPYGHIFGK